MKKLLFLLVLIFVISGCSLTNTENKEVKENTVKVEQYSTDKPVEEWGILDYYLALYNEVLFPYGFSPYFSTGDEITLEDKMGFIDILDEENYYIKIKRPAGAMAIERELALFLSDDKDILMYSGSTHEMESFYEYVEGDLRDITSEIWEGIVEKDCLKEAPNKMVDLGIIEELGERNPCVFIIPRYGTDILYGNKYDDIYLCRIKWQNGKFVVEEY